MAGGAVVAAAAAARAKRVQTILDAFRIADATSPARPQSLARLGLERTSELEQLIEQQVIVPAPPGDRWYLSESAYIAHRDSESSTAARRGLVLVLALAAVGALLAIAVYRGA